MAAGKVGNPGTLTEGDQKKAQAKPALSGHRTRKRATLKDRKLLDNKHPSPGKQHRKQNKTQKPVSQALPHQEKLNREPGRPASLHCEGALLLSGGRQGD